MDIMDYLDKAMHIEEHLAECYKALAAWCGPKYAPEMNKLSAEETNHRNILNVGKNYITNAPDLFGGVKIPEADLDYGLKTIPPILGSIRAKKIDLLSAFKELLELERGFERVHLQVSVEIKEASLRELFKGLSAGDRSHIAALERIVKELEIGVGPR